MVRLLSKLMSLNPSMDDLLFVNDFEIIVKQLTFNRNPGMVPYMGPPKI